MYLCLIVSLQVPICAQSLSQLAYLSPDSSNTYVVVPLTLMNRICVFIPKGLSFLGQSAVVCMLAMLPDQLFQTGDLTEHRRKQLVPIQRSHHQSTLLPFRTIHQSNQTSCPASKTALLSINIMFELSPSTIHGPSLK